MMSLLMDSGSRAVLCQDGPEDEDASHHPGWRILDNRVRTARRRHLCAGGCDVGSIEPGQPYQRLVVIEDGKLTCARLCLGCGAGRRA
jgi:hypothetical protein